MKTQISREGFRADRRYSGVYQQQGRLITDRDWNELVEILKARLDDALADVIGSGSPKQKAAAISMAGGAPKITPGVVYAGGVEARLVAAPGVSASPFGYHEQADFPSPPPPPAAGTAYRLYADLWERPVVSLEDQDLRDAGLHGADTCTRTQTMAQVKWCPANKDPENPADNPGRGNALLTVAFPQSGGPASSDPCDPQTQAVDPVGGDFLFRLEVHDARWPAGAAPNAPDRVVVKWSRENGAEQFLYEDMPDWFESGSWVYELFNLDAEKHPGFHLANSAGWTPKRGTLTATLPTTAPAGVTSARRWDGWCVLVRSGSTWAVSTAAGETPAETAPDAQVQVSNGKLVVNLTDLVLTLELAGKILLPGDYWSAAVRRASHQAGAELLKSTPMGVLHRYVTLAEVQANGQLRARTAPEQRKLAFPRLSELDAGDVGYATSCNSGLFDTTHDSVKKALDRLCSISSDHIAYPKPCDTSVYKGATVETVKDALGLLCNVTAEQISYSPAQFPGIQEVRSALNELFGRPVSGGNYVTVGQGGQFQTIDLALQVLEPQTLDIALALMPGDHSIGSFAFGGQRDMHVSIVGLGGATRVHMNAAGPNTSFSALGSFRLERVHLISQNKTLDISGCYEVILADNVFESNHLEGNHFIHVAQNDRLVVRGNHIDVQWEAPDLFLVNMLQLDEFEDIEDMFSVNLTEFRERARVLAQAIQSAPDRIAIGEGIVDRGNNDTRPPLIARNAYIALGRSILDDEAKIARRLEDLRFVLYNLKPGTGIVIGSLNGPTLIEGNQGTGLIGLLGRASSNVSLNIPGFIAAAQGGRFPLPNARHSLQIKNNSLPGVRAGETLVNDLVTAINTGSTREIPSWYRQVEVIGNVFEQGDNYFFGTEVTVNGNNFSMQNSIIAGFTIGSAGIYVNNRAVIANSRILSGIKVTDFVQGSNLRMTVQST